MTRTKSQLIAAVRARLDETKEAIIPGGFSEPYDRGSMNELDWFLSLLEKYYSKEPSPFVPLPLPSYSSQPRGYFCGYCGRWNCGTRPGERRGHKDIWGLM